MAAFRETHLLLPQGSLVEGPLSELKDGVFLTALRDGGYSSTTLLPPVLPSRTHLQGSSQPE